VEPSLQVTVAAAASSENAGLATRAVNATMLPSNKLSLFMLSPCVIAMCVLPSAGPVDHARAVFRIQEGQPKQRPRFGA
jgi:hypothetical protein